ncbi:MAG: TIGR03936 family radical SAM-associated protein [Clostridia bacterium]|nr:TIGR03936 family radical SAM-associated protein [Clostridia bacterium]
MSEKFKLRFEFEKSGRIRFISHLDLLRVMQRVFKRAGVPLWHSEGFNPHPYIAFGQPLSLGHEGLCEIVDTALTEECADPAALCAAINAVAPEGLRMLRAWVPTRPLKEIVYADYETLVFDAAEADIPEMLSRVTGEKCVVLKKSGKKFVELDIIPLIRSVKMEPAAEGVRILSRVACGASKVLNPQYIADGAVGRQGVSARHKRICLLDGEENIFC